MNEEFSAIYVDGIFRPLDPVNLPENGRVRIRVVSAEPPATLADDEKSLYDSLVEAGLLGCMDGGPTDLSTNPKYMDGFGETSDSD